MQDAWLRHVCLDLQHEDSSRRQSPRCRNVWRREESGVLEASQAHICQLIGGSICQVCKNCVSPFDESCEKQRGNVRMCIGVWLEIGCSGCKGESPVTCSDSVGCVLLCFIDPRVRKIRNEVSSCPGIFSRTLRFCYVASSPGSPLPHLLDGHRKLVGYSAILARSVVRGESNFFLKSKNKLISSFFFVVLYLLSLPFSWLYLLALSHFGSVSTIGPCSPSHKKKKSCQKKSRHKKKYCNSIIKYLPLTSKNPPGAAGLSPTNLAMGPHCCLECLVIFVSTASGEKFSVWLAREIPNKTIKRSKNKSFEKERKREKKTRMTGYRSPTPLTNNVDWHVGHGCPPSFHVC